VRRAFPIVAFVEKLGASPRKVASLYVGRWDSERLLYAGKVGTSYTEMVARDLPSASIPTSGSSRSCRYRW
jgi:bifunctional non-homologous end joining protein LigD